MLPSRVVKERLPIAISIAALVVAVHHGRSVFVVDDRAPDAGLFLGVLDGRWCYAVDVRDDNGVPRVERAGIVRTARTLMDGFVFPRAYS